MPTRRPYIGGNWKMNTNAASGPALAKAVRDGARAAARSSDIVLFPPFVSLHLVMQALDDSPLRMGAQDVCPEPDGAFTGEISVSMLQDCGASAVIVGHSERRHIIGEDDGLVNRKARAVLDAGLQVVLCVGETLAQREAGETMRINLGQLAAGLDGVDEQRTDQLVIAYEPVWAIGTGRTASPQDAQDVHAALRRALADRFGGAAADAIRIIYGGSVKPGNAAELFSKPDIDGGLIGGASLDAADFLAIAGAASSAYDDGPVR